MFTTDRIAQITTALAGAIVISALSVGAAVGPVRASAPGQSWIAAVPLVAPSAGDRAVA